MLAAEAMCATGKRCPELVESIDQQHGLRHGLAKKREEFLNDFNSTWLRG